MTQPLTLYGWFARSAARYAQHTALEVDGVTLTYGQLQELAERLAGRLLAEAGGRVPRRVGLLASRSVTAYAGYLAVLRLGATVVPLNPEFPAARTATMVASAHLDLVLADTPGGGDEFRAPVVVVPPAELAGPGLAPHPPLPQDPTGLPDPARPDDTAYIIFTSGSTGTPKGVPILHRNICSYLAHVVERADAGPGSRLSQTFDLTFDGSVYDLFVAWSSGGTLVVPRRSQLLSPVKFINTHRITHWFSVPSLVSFAARLNTLRPGCMPTLRHSVFGGEPLTLEHARAWQAAAPDSTVEILYGPTELTISCTEYRLPRDPAQWPSPANGIAPIGTGYPSMEMVLLDADGSPATTGELCFRGPQRFPGYLDPANNPGRFVEFDGSGPARPYTGDGPLTEHHWYRTGDRATLQDGLLIHLGRTDHQVKIRGHRVELGDVEAPLRELTGVQDAVVVPVDGKDGEPELVAAVSGVGLDTERLYAALGERLPPYMLPRQITVFDELPLNAHGKIDRRALRDRLTAARGSAALP